MSDLRRLDLMRGYRVASRDVDREPTVAPAEERPADAIEIRIEESLATRRFAAVPVRRKAP